MGSSSEFADEEVGATLGALPGGYRHDRHEVALGEGDRFFGRAVQGLREWAAHREAGLQVRPDRPSLVAGTSLLVILPLPLVSAAGACRIVYVVDEPDAFGFAYGTLPVHPERGEEAFVIRRSPAGKVRFEVTAFSRPWHPLARLGGPVGRKVQLDTTRRYLEALKAFAADH